MRMITSTVTVDASFSLKAHQIKNAKIYKEETIKLQVFRSIRVDSAITHTAHAAHKTLTAHRKYMLINRKVSV